MQRNGSEERKAIFLDRDGVITEEPPHYAHGRDQMALIPGAAAAIKMLNDRNFLVVVVTNQAGIARGIFEEKDMVDFNEALQEELATTSGAKIDAIYWCAHHPDAKQEQYRVACECRKPQMGMLTRASGELSISLENSYLVGDKWSDVEAGKNAGCKTIMVRTGHGERELADSRGRNADHYVSDILEAARVITGEGNMREV